MASRDDKEALNEHEASSLPELEMGPPAYTPSQDGEDVKYREKKWKEELAALKAAMLAYDEAEKKGDEKIVESTVANVVTILRRLEATHTDPAVKNACGDKASKLAKGGKKQRSDIFKGIVMLSLVPFMLLGGVFAAAGGVFYGTKSILKGVGDILTFGRFRREAGTGEVSNKNGTGKVQQKPKGRVFRLTFRVNIPVPAKPNSPKVQVQDPQK